jgi:hypothetical protein
MWVRLTRHVAVQKMFLYLTPNFYANNLNSESLNASLAHFPIAVSSPS